MASDSSSAGLAFCVSMIARGGLTCLETHLGGSGLPLMLRRCGYDGKHILCVVPGEEDTLDLDMDSSDDERMFASGEVHGTTEQAAALLDILSQRLQAAAVPHEVLLDDAQGKLAKRWSWRWAEHRESDPA